MRLLVLTVLLFTGCAAYQRAWDKSVELHGRCELQCDAWAKANGAGLPAIRYIPETDTCRCWSPLTPWERDSARPVIVEFIAPKIGDSL